MEGKTSAPPTMLISLCPKMRSDIAKNHPVSNHGIVSTQRILCKLVITLWIKVSHIHNTRSEKLKVTLYILRLSPRQRNHAYNCFATCIHKANPLNLKQYNMWIVSIFVARFLAPKIVGFQLIYNPLSMLPISLPMHVEGVHITSLLLRCWIPINSQPSIHAPN